MKPIQLLHLPLVIHWHLLPSVIKLLVYALSLLFYDFSFFLDKN